MLLEGLYIITSFEQQDAEVTAMIELHKEHDIFKGHFPGNPVMPGVCMLQMIKELTEKATGKNLFLSVSSNIKFMAIINPEVNPVLKVAITISEEDGVVKIKNTSSFEDTVALKLSATFKVIA
ncbi:3-hydroxyacyl-ACP dehydratase [Ulvibacter litoralis]|uniref:3-hydroxyacyl-[acyl-carrier-protein] dehydratase n=1 Tax=Ulvibacter litoralis TaxID=227084 RepID=A0A1G7DTM4_9FLAO|nr:3-hydroxyacyl-ACP dehydratase [Ulvibacter litoralis]GHC42364.1 3-hydroxyacyl-ACP dehydratase [Ulvibacter litoralis]SDE54791.1 3-hydroxyacyl-[acyl-carrier-protein] dehydratase [Ulvibacter litoralis]